MKKPIPTFPHIISGLPTAPAPASPKPPAKHKKTPRQLLTDLRQDALNAREAAEYPDDEAWAEAQTHAYTTALNVLGREGYE